MLLSVQINVIMLGISAVEAHPRNPIWFSWPLSLQFPQTCSCLHLNHTDNGHRTAACHSTSICSFILLFFTIFWSAAPRKAPLNKLCLYAIERHISNIKLSLASHLDFAHLCICFCQIFATVVFIPVSSVGFAVASIKYTLFFKRIPDLLPSLSILKFFWFWA